MNSAAETIIYLKKSTKALMRYPSWQTFHSIIKYFSVWRSHHGVTKSSIEDKMPWLAFSAIDFLHRISKKEMIVFEYGSGGSTLFWASRVRHVISIEHDKPWFDRVQREMILQQIENVDYILSEPKKDPDYAIKNFQDPDAYISTDKNYSGETFEEYVKIIDRYPDAYFDIIIVDGRARTSCIKHAIGKLKRNGYLVVDNTERKNYLSTFIFDGPDWIVRSFAGPVPYSYGFSETKILKKLK